MAGEKQQPTFIEELKIPIDNKTPNFPVLKPLDLEKRWPELVALPAEEAAKKIEEIPGIQILVVRSDIATMDFISIALFDMLIVKEIVKEKLNLYPGLANGWPACSRN